jgi:prepilin-type processing-associated H-X9-DG protein
MTPRPYTYCPSRRQPHLYPTPYSNNNCPYVPNVAKTDYAANAGSQNRNEIDGGSQNDAVPTDHTGVSYRKSTVKFKDITGGTSNVIMVGEKYLNPDNYINGVDGSDNEHAYCGYNNDVYRVTFNPPLQDRRGLSDTFRFGGPHVGGLMTAFCDGSVRIVNWNVTPAIWLKMGNRFEGGSEQN